MGAVRDQKEPALAWTIYARRVQELGKEIGFFHAALQVNQEERLSFYDAFNLGNAARLGAYSWKHDAEPEHWMPMDTLEQKAHWGQLLHGLVRENQEAFKLFPNEAFLLACDEMDVSYKIGKDLLVAAAMCAGMTEDHVIAMRAARNKVQ